MYTEKLSSEERRYRHLYLIVTKNRKAILVPIGFKKFAVIFWILDYGFVQLQKENGYYIVNPSERLVCNNVLF